MFSVDSIPPCAVTRAAAADQRTRTLPAMETLRTLQALGLELPSAAYLVGAVVFGVIGLLAWRSGRRLQNRRRLWLGVALMFYPYAVPNTVLLYAVGAGLCAALWLDARPG